jgi:predicted anti-sigma-YlaC factor YlaD
MKQKKDCAALRGYLQDCLDRGVSPAAEKSEEHLTRCPDCRAFAETLSAAAAGLQAALTARVEALPPLDPAVLKERIRAGLSRRRHSRKRRLAGIAAALVLAVGLSAAAAGILSRRRSLTLTEAGGDYLLDILFADNLLLESADPNLALEGNGGWLADTLESEKLYSMEPLTVF